MFGLAVVLFPVFTLLHLAIFFFTTLAMIFYICYESPFETEFINKMELFNELMNLVTLYHLVCFTDFVPSPKVRY